MRHVLAYDYINNDAIDKHSVSDMTVDGDSTRTVASLSCADRSCATTFDCLSCVQIKSIALAIISYSLVNDPRAQTTGTFMYS